MTIRCGNHGSARVYHKTAQDARNCYAGVTEIPRDVAEDLRQLASVIEYNLAMGKTVETSPEHLRALADKLDPPQPRPEPQGPAPRGWWDLPIAASMWGEVD